MAAHAGRQGERTLVRSPFANGLIAGILIRLLRGHPRRHQCVFRSVTNIPRGFQGASDIGVLRAGVEGDEPHAIWALHLIAALEP